MSYKEIVNIARQKFGDVYVEKFKPKKITNAFGVRTVSWIKR